MKKKTLIAIISGLGLITIVTIVVVLGGPGNLFQSALYNIRPIYSGCRIEGKNYNSEKTEDCEHFQEKLARQAFPDGEYTIFAKYSDKRLSDNVIPVKISGKTLDCSYLSNNYQPDFSIHDPSDPRSSQSIEPGQEIPMKDGGMILAMKYKKNGQTYYYDTNICESAFKVQLTDSKKTVLGSAQMDHNGFINSRPLTNEILINNTPYYQGESDQPVKVFQPGNIFLHFNASPDFSIKMTIPCSSSIPVTKVPTISTATTTPINFQGVSQEYFQTCGDRLYLSFQNANRYDDIENLNGTGFSFTGDGLTYLLDPSSLGRVMDKNAVFPLIFKVNLMLRDRSDSKEAFTLGSGLITITARAKTLESTQTSSTYTNQNSAVSITDQASTADNRSVLIDINYKSGQVASSPEAASSTEATSEKTLINKTSDSTGLIKPKVRPLTSNLLNSDASKTAVENTSMSGLNPVL